jgi:hypothetical protein
MKPCEGGSLISAFSCNSLVNIPSLQYEHYSGRMRPFSRFYASAYRSPTFWCIVIEIGFGYLVSETFLNVDEEYNF